MKKNKKNNLILKKMIFNNKKLIKNFKIKIKKLSNKKKS